VVCPAQSIWS